jgi:hypothetical protein
VWEALGGNNSKMYMFFKDPSLTEKEKKISPPIKNNFIH